jgi:hypothetical protein
MNTERTQSTPPSESVSPAEDRNRQLTAAAWILGWIGGPLPAVAILIVTRTPHWSRRLIMAAAAFWSVMWLVLLALVFAYARGDVPAFAAWWIGAILIALATTAVATRVALRRSEQSDERASW